MMIRNNLVSFLAAAVLVSSAAVAVSQGMEGTVTTRDDPNSGKAYTTRTGANPAHLIGQYWPVAR